MADRDDDSAPVDLGFADAPTERTMSLLPRTVSLPPESGEGFELRYQVGAALGQGGMSEVLRARDLRVGREVALKIARDDLSGDSLARFTRECRLQGQLEHPGIVPVHDVGRRPDGAMYFTMKRVRGQTLRAILSRLAAHDPEAEKRFTRRRLLAAFLQVCQTLEFAHQRGVVHRDLKPANVMLGDYGEVYVLDWGIAKVRDREQEGEAIEAPEPEPAFFDPAFAEEVTVRGALLGTLGYMAPEQLRDAASVDRRADVYALGAILFELLTLRPLHAGPRAMDLLESTMRPTETTIRSALDAETSMPELFDACMRATAHKRQDRTASAGELVEIVGRYLDGDRDFSTRKELAEQAVEAARVALDRAESEGLGSAARAEVLRHAGRALALDGDSEPAQQVLSRLFGGVRDEEEQPPEVAANVERALHSAYKKANHAGALLFSAWLPFIAISALNTVQRGPLLAWSATILVAIAMFVLNGRTQRREPRMFFATLVAALTAIVMASRVVGPYILVPGVTTMTILVFILFGRRRWHSPTIALGLVAVTLPAVLEVSGLVPSTTTFDPTGIHIRTSMGESLAPWAKSASMIAAITTLYLVVSVAAGRLQRVLASQTRRASIVSWQLGALAPTGKKHLVAPVSSKRASSRGRKPKR